MDISGFMGDGQWYKGNLHCHTIVSDGRLSPKEAVDYYKSHGYSFLAISDHNIFTDFGGELNSEDFIVLPAVEASAVLYDSQENRNKLKVHHMHGIAMPKEALNDDENLLNQENVLEQTEIVPLKHMEEVPMKAYFGGWQGAKVAQDLCDELIARDCFVIYNHPLWSKVREDEWIDTKGLTAVEIYNHGACLANGTGYDTSRWDIMLCEGKKVWGIAADDNHNDEETDDSFGGFIVVKAPELTAEALTKSIIDGNFYASTGPQIYDWGIHDQMVYVTCSPVQRIHFIVGNAIGSDAYVASEDGADDVDYGLLRLRGDEMYVRVECIDSWGRVAWSNPIFLKENLA